MSFNNTDPEIRFERLLKDIDSILPDDEKADIIDWICRHGEYELALSSIVAILQDEDINLSLDVIRQLEELTAIMNINLYDDSAFN